MEATSPTPGTADQGMEQILLMLAKTHHWAGLYGTSHPVLAERVREAHAALLSRLSTEPGNRLILGIARDKVLYGNAFLGEKLDLVGRLTEALYLLQVATIEFGPELSSEGLLSFLRLVHESGGKVQKEGAAPLHGKAEIPGIRLNPYNYKELLSRKLVEPDGEGGKAAEREEALWRTLLTSNTVSDDGGEGKIAEEIGEFPELLQAVLHRARSSTGSETISLEVLRRLFRHLGRTLRHLTDEKRKEVLAFLGEGLGERDGVEEDPALSISLVRSLTDECSEGEFLDLLGTLLAVEEKGGLRIRKVFETIAVDRNAGNALLPIIAERAKESLRARNYYSLKTWEAIEKLLLSRSEEAYVEKEHARFLEAISAGRIRLDAPSAATASPELLASLEQAALHRKAILVLLELLAREKDDGEFLDQLEETGKLVPNLISRGEVEMLRKVLDGLAEVLTDVVEERRAPVREVLAQTDFGHLVDRRLSRDPSPEESERILSLLAAFAPLSVNPILDRLLSEPDHSRRRILLAMTVRLGPAAVPEILARLSHPTWYFVRNLCSVLGDIGDKAAVPGLVNATGHGDPRVRREAIAALGKIRPPEAVPVLGKILLEESLFSMSKDDPVRIAAASALYTIGGTEALSFLHRGEEVRRTPVRDHCRELVRGLREKR